jgi:hypothetical protein
VCLRFIGWRTGHSSVCGVGGAASRTGYVRRAEGRPLLTKGPLKVRVGAREECLVAVVMIQVAASPAMVRAAGKVGSVAESACWQGWNEVVRRCSL